MADLLRLATAGSVDDGKSTLVGRLLYDTKSVLADQLAAVERASSARGLDQVDLALLTDGLRAEREQGITIDVAYRYFATPTRSFILADTPGHVQYTRNMVTGASTAQAAVILVDARKGVVEQTRRHTTVAALLGVRHVVLAVNKMDLVGWDEKVFVALRDELTCLTADLGVTDTTAIPLSALLGDNVVERSASTPWYSGPTLLEHLEQLPLSDDSGDQPLRFPVQYVIRPQSPDRPDYRGYAGRIEQGTVRVDDDVTVLPAGRRTTVVGIDTADGPLAAASSPQSVTLLLADDIDVARGDLVATGHLPEVVREIEGTVCWLSETPLRGGARVLVRHGTRTVRGLVDTIVERLDVDALTLTTSPETLSLNEIGRVRVRLAEPLPVDDYRDQRSTGAFLLVDPADGDTVAAGMVGDPLGGTAARRRCRVEASASDLVPHATA